MNTAFIAVSVEYHLLSIMEREMQTLRYSRNKKILGIKKISRKEIGVFLSKTGSTKLTIICYAGE